MDRWSLGKLAGRAAAGYATALGAILAVQLTVGDRTPLLFAINSLLLYGFLPAPLLLLVGLWRRDTLLLAAFGGLLLAWAWLWGGLFVPRIHAVEGPRLRVLTYNALGYNFDTQDTLRVVRDSNADVVALQELNLETAAALTRELGDRYPYRWLEPRNGVEGGGFLSKYAFERSADQIGGSWVGRPMAIDIEFSGRQVTLVRFHAHAGPSYVALRETQARSLASYARRRPGPLVLLGDLNATDSNVAHALIAEQLRDAWREAGFGFGHTFPGRPTRSEGGSRPIILGVAVPLWLVRIDYVFHSPDWVTQSAQVTPAAGRSDHRGVVAELVLNRVGAPSARRAAAVRFREAR